MINNTAHHLTGLNMTEGKKQIRYTLYTPNRTDIEDTDIAKETQARLSVNGDVWLSFMCTPVDLDKLAIGFLYNEEIIHSIEEVEMVQVCPSGENIDVWLKSNPSKPSDWMRTSGCTGGTTSITSTNVHSIKKRELNFPATIVGKLLGIFTSKQNLYQATGGIHSSALSDGKKIDAIYEDIGRHNTLDKLAGWCLTENGENSPPIIITTGRITSEMLQKSHRIGASIVISRTSPTSLSIAMAENMDITLIGYARRNQFKVYSHTRRITNLK